MKKILFLALFLPLFVHAQSIKNVDLKNGFLQFHLGDSISKHKNDIYIPWKNHPDQNEVKQSALGPYRKFIEKVNLINVDGYITEIDIFVMKEGAEAYLDKLMEQCYGKGYEEPNLDKYQEGTHLSHVVWKGQRATAMIIQTNINRRVGGTMTHGRIQSIIFTKVSNDQVDGSLPDNFPL
jgi:hypothetical protein